MATKPVVIKIKTVLSNRDFEKISAFMDELVEILNAQENRRRHMTRFAFDVASVAIYDVPIYGRLKFAQTPIHGVSATRFPVEMGSRPEIPNIPPMFAIINLLEFLSKQYSCEFQFRTSIS